MSLESPFEAVIVGGAVVGAALARGLRGARAALIAQGPPPASASSPSSATGFDPRVYAISPGNAAWLAQLGVWAAIPEARKTPVHAMRVYGDDGESLIEFDAYGTGCSELAWIVEDGLLQEALWRGMERREGLSVFSESAVRQLAIDQDCARLVLEDGRRLSAKLVVGADGAHSLVRAQAGIAIDEHRYAQTAVVANLACARPHRNVALQWFQGARSRGAVLALLPLPGNRVSMVWSMSDSDAARLLALDAAALAGKVAEDSRHALGELAVITPARGFALQRLTARRLIAPRIALAGDAAHVIHPLAGQGANLGLQDARALAAVLRDREPERDPGDLRLLRRYERARAEDILAMRAAVHGLFRLFQADGTRAARLRNAGLNLMDRIPVVKNVLMRHAMG